MVRRLHQTMADYAVIAISPALIMTLVGSLVFFLLEVLYTGEFSGRLHWVMACFVFAAVLIGRISIEEGFERAAMFGTALAVSVGIAANRFVEIQGDSFLAHFGWAINWGLIALIWWCTHRLTWDCTLIDDEQDSSGEGLLQVAGLERGGDDRNQTAGSSKPGAFIEGTTARVKAGWWQQHVERQRRPHAPGVWVVYFSLAALPLFGIGQWFIPEAQVAGRRYAFWLLAIYVASGMGLLLTTSFLGLRRYLRQRRIEMPALMANLWLGTGAVVIGLLLLLSALLPRPSAEYAVSRLPFSLGSPKEQASRMAPVPREGARGEQPGTAPDTKPPDDDAQGEQVDSKSSAAEPVAGASGKGAAQPPQESSAAGDKASGSPPAGSSEGAKAPASSGSSGQQGQSSSEKNGSAQQSPLKSSDAASKEPAERPREPSPPQQRDQASDEERGGKPSEGPSRQRSELANKIEQLKSGQPADQPQAEPTDKRSASEPAQPAAAPSLPTSGVETAVGAASELFKWVFYALFILAVAYFAWRSRREILSVLRGLLAALANWRQLLGGRRRKPSELLGIELSDLPPATFSTFADPFATGIAGRYSTLELVLYSFEAFEAWSREHGCPRKPDQTPHELARDVARQNADMAADARNIAELYARAAFAKGELPVDSGEQLRKLWLRMRSSMASSW